VPPEGHQRHTQEHQGQRPQHQQQRSQDVRPVDGERPQQDQRHDNRQLPATQQHQGVAHRTIQPLRLHPAGAGQDLVEIAPHTAQRLAVIGGRGAHLADHPRAQRFRQVGQGLVGVGHQIVDVLHVAPFQARPQILDQRRQVIKRSQDFVRGKGRFRMAARAKAPRQPAQPDQLPHSGRDLLQSARRLE